MFDRQVADSSQQMVQHPPVSAGVPALPGADAQAAQLISNLGLQAWKEFEDAREAKREITELMLQDLRMLRGEYDPEDEAIIREEGGSRIYLPTVANKVTLAASMLYTIYLDNQRPFEGKPSPVPEIPPEILAAIQQMAQTEAMSAIEQGVQVGTPQDLLFERMESIKADVLRRAKEWAEKQADYNADQVDDVLREGGFYECFSDFAHDACAMRGGFIKGPEVRIMNDMDWGPDGRPIKVKKHKRVYSAPSPFDIFPGRGAVKCNDSTLSERVVWNRGDLHAMIGVPGFREDVIRQVLAEYDGGAKLTNWYWEDSERTRLETLSSTSLFRRNIGTIDAIEHWTHVDGKTLLDFGHPPELITDQQASYSVVLWMVGPSRVIGVRINDDPKMERPYFKAGYRSVRGSFWYEGACAIGRPYQRVINATARAQMNNMGMAAGFVTEIQADRLAKGETVRKPVPYEMYQTVQARNGASGPAMFFHQAQLHTDLYERSILNYQQQLDDALGLPSFLAGMNLEQGAGGTSSGLAQLRQMQTQAFGYFTLSVDTLIEGVTGQTHRDLILTPDGEHLNATDPSSPRRLVGDVYFEARGAHSVAERQGAQVRLNELLQLTANEIDMSIIGNAGRAEILREAVAGFDAIDPARVVPSRDTLVTREAQQRMAEQQGMVPPAAKQPEQGAALDAAGNPVGAGQHMVAA